MNDQPSASTHKIVYIDEPVGKGGLVLITTILQRHGIEVLSTESVNEGWDLIATKRPNLVLLDPGLSDGFYGDPFLRQLKADPDLCQIPVVILTARDDKDYRESCLQLGAVDFISKWPSPHDLIDSINKILDHADQRGV